MRIAMVGAGGVGGHFGARLIHAGHEVFFVARGAHAQALRTSGLRVESPLGNLDLKAVHVLDEGERPDNLDLAVVAVKLWDSEGAAQTVARLAGPSTAALSLQNGVEKDDVLSRALGRERVLGAVTYVTATLTEPGHIVQTGTLQRVVVGELQGPASARVNAVVGAFRSAGIDAAASDDVRRVTWEKFVFLSAVSGMTALTRAPAGPVRGHSATRAMLLASLEEAAAVARAEGAALDASFVPQQMQAIDALAPQALSSMANDLLRGRRLELEHLSGAIVRLAAKHRLAVPSHQAIYAALVLHAQGPLGA
jgi:2-dehydropantoate 2-reductase